DSRARVTEMVTELIRAGTTVEGARDIDFELTAVALVGAGEAVADRITEGDVDLETATDLLVGITWRGLKGVGTADVVAE
ncbi:TetR/AcrR family transcriptional regulator, partial [Streptomyces sp. SID10244]|nr:TetR/AcrR family transcriptional regulator [Streptomyces sp. SID10244]